MAKWKKLNPFKSSNPDVLPLHFYPAYPSFDSGHRAKLKQLNPSSIIYLTLTIIIILLLVNSLSTSYRQPEPEDNVDDDDGETPNVTHRIEKLFPKVDVAPADGFVTAEELTGWLTELESRHRMHHTKRMMERLDQDEDGFLSFQEYDNNKSSSADLGWWKEDHFNAADADGDGLLNLTELHDFLHPSEATGRPKLVQWMSESEIREVDNNGDGKLNFDEFFHGLFDPVRDYGEAEYHQSDTALLSEAQQLFQQLDQDRDGFLSQHELKPLIRILHPSQHHYAKQQAEHLIAQADTDNDGQLSLKEMIKYPYVFYSAAFDDDDD